MQVQMAKSSAFAHLLTKLIQSHVDSYTGSPGFASITEPDEVASSDDEGFVQMHVTMPDGSEYRIEVEYVPDAATTREP